MPSQNSTNLYEQASIAASRIAGFYSKIGASDPEVFLTGLIELLASYPRTIIERAMSATRGLPIKVKYLNSLHDVRSVLEEWAEDERRHREVLARHNRPALEAITGPRYSMVDELRHRFGMRGIPHGWDAVDITKAAAKYGDRLPEVIDQILRVQTAPAPKSAFEKAAEAAAEAMEPVAPVSRETPTP